MHERARAEGDRICMPEIIAREELCNQIARNAKLTQIIGEQAERLAEKQATPIASELGIEGAWLQTVVTPEEMIALLPLLNRVGSTPRRARSPGHRFIVGRVLSHGKHLLRIDIMDPREEKDAEG